MPRLGDAVSTYGHRNLYENSSAVQNGPKQGSSPNGPGVTHTKRAHRAVESFSAEQRMDVLTPAAVRTDLKGTVIWEQSPSQKTTLCTIPLQDGEISRNRQ